MTPTAPIATRPEPTTALAPSLNFQSLMAAAIEKGREGVETLKELVALNRQLCADAAVEAFSRAMADLKNALPPIQKDAEGQHGVTRKGGRVKGLYAPLDTIAKALDPVAARFGLSYRFDREVVDGKDYVACIVTHAQGHSIRSRYPAPVDAGPGRSAVQAIGSGNSYAQRYALIAAFGITTADPDDDADAAGRDDFGGPAITEKDVIDLTLRTDSLGNKAEFLAYFGIEAIKDLPASRLAEAKDGLARRERRGK